MVQRLVDLQSFLAHWLDWICCLKGEACAQQPGQRGGVGFSAEAWDVRQESSAQRPQGKKDLVEKVLVSGGALAAVTQHHNCSPPFGDPCGCEHACVCSADE